MAAIVTIAVVMSAKQIPRSQASPKWTKGHGNWPRVAIGKSLYSVSNHFASHIAGTEQNLLRISKVDRCAPL